MRQRRRIAYQPESDTGALPVAEPISVAVERGRAA